VPAFDGMDENVTVPLLAKVSIGVPLVDDKV
jgi:hypothetical protein